MIKTTLTALTIAIFLSGMSYGQNEGKQGSKKRNQSSRQRQGMNRSASGNQQGGFQIEAVFKRFDKNGDGVLTVDEVPARMKNRMQALDKDGNNDITLQELSAAMQTQRGRGRFQQRNGGDKNGNRNQAMGQRKMDGAQTAEFMFKRMDKNGDGVISKDEAPERMQEKFARMDKNGNDQLDKNEFVAVLEIMKAEGGKKGGRYNTDPSKTRPVAPKRPPRK